MRGPINGETPLSKAEVEHGIEVGIIDALPVRQRVKQVGEWELKTAKNLAKATPFDGLLV